MRGTYAATQACLPHLQASARAGRGPHVLTLAPPPTLDPRWYRDHVAYTIAKMGMSLCVLGHAEEFRADGIARQRAVAAHRDHAPRRSRCCPASCDDAGPPAHGRRSSPTPRTRSSSRDPTRCTGRFFIDEEALREAGVTDFGRYAVEPGRDLMPDLFLDPT